MKISVSSMVLFVAAFVILASESLRGEEKFIPLFNGKDLSGWCGNPGTTDPEVWAKTSADEKAKKQKEYDANLAKHWSVKDGEIVSDGHGVFLSTEKDYGNFELVVDWKLMGKGGDSGIYLRGYPQVQIWDPANLKEKVNGADKGSGALWNNIDAKNGKFPLVLADNPIGEWNTFKIKMVGSHVTVYFNDKLTVDNATLDNYWSKGKTPIVDRGPIQLQTHGSEVRFRNIKIREFPSELKESK